MCVFRDRVGKKKDTAKTKKKKAKNYSGKVEDNKENSVLCALNSFFLMFFQL